MIASMIKGFQHFRDHFFGADKAFFQRLTKRGQTPKIMVISCSDSRVDPAILFDTRPGELFVVRNVANLVPPYAPDDGHHGVSAAIEFGVRDLKVAHIVILGHAFCGGIQALCNHHRNQLGTQQNTIQIPDREFLKSWITIASPAMTDIDFTSWQDDKQHQAERAAIRNSLQNLKEFKWIKQGIDNGSLSVHGWWFDMEGGALWGYDEDIDTFIRLVPASGQKLGQA